MSLHVSKCGQQRYFEGECHPFSQATQRPGSHLLRCYFPLYVFIQVSQAVLKLQYVICATQGSLNQNTNKTQDGL